MTQLSAIGVSVPDILLPQGVDAAKWACIACDQYTSQPEVWLETEKIVGDAPSTLRIVLPEVWLGEADARIPAIHAHMRQYLDTVLTRTVHGFILTARTTQSGCRKGLMLAIDLEQYDFSAGSRSRVRATEGTILSRIPPRQKVRRGAPLESPHVMLLIDDRRRTLIEPLYEKLHGTSPLYDAELYQGMGHLTGWAVQDAADLAAVQDALLALDAARGDAPLFAVGDGNHSLATAKACWEELKPALSPEQQQTHPARYALVEVVNLYDDALTFAPIHRVLTGADPEDLRPLLRAAGDGSSACATLVAPQGEEAFPGLPVHVLQPLLDDYLAAHPDASIDYVHGDEAARTLGRRPGCCALLLTTLDKLALFPAVARGPLPRKAFSMGQANEKRCYFECRAL